MKSPLIIVCEGSSEENYIIQLNRIFRYTDSECRVVFIACNAHGGKYSFVRKNITKLSQEIKNKKIVSKSGLTRTYT